jgi:hypothetical protein
VTARRDRGARFPFGRTRQQEPQLRGEGPCPAQIARTMLSGTGCAPRSPRSVRRRRQLNERAETPAPRTLRMVKRGHVPLHTQTAGRAQGDLSAVAPLLRKSCSRTLTGPSGETRPGTKRTPIGCRCPDRDGRQGLGAGPLRPPKWRNRQTRRTQNPPGPPRTDPRKMLKTQHFPGVLHFYPAGPFCDQTAEMGCNGAVLVTGWSQAPGDGRRYRACQVGREWRRMPMSFGWCRPPE